MRLSSRLARTILGLGLIAFLPPLQAMTLVTWNVAELFDPDPLRIEKLLDVALSTSPDLVLLQEAGPKTYAAVKRINRSGRAYRLIHKELPGGLPSGGLVILVKSEFRVDKAAYQDLPSEMGRGVLSVGFDWCGKSLHILNVHLESPDLLFWRSLKFRHQQIDLINQITKEPSDSIVAGDFNLVFERNPDQLFPAHWQDAWIHTHPGEKGLTWDPDHNAMAYQSGGFLLPGYRLDRVLIDSDSVRAKEVKRLGMEFDPPLSDHYGLWAEFVCRQK